MITIEHRQQANRITDIFAADHTRSVEHMNAMRAVMAWRLAGKPKGGLDENPYKPGTCQWEAWTNGRLEALEIEAAAVERLSS